MNVNKLKNYLKRIFISPKYQIGEKVSYMGKIGTILSYRYDTKFGVFLYTLTNYLDYEISESLLEAI